MCTAIMFENQTLKLSTINPRNDPNELMTHKYLQHILLSGSLFTQECTENLYLQ